MSEIHSSTEASQPVLSQTDAAASLLSLSIAAANAVPILVSGVSTLAGTAASTGVNGNLSVSLTSSHPASPLLGSNTGHGNKHHRRLSSTGKTKRRLSDARDAANRPSPILLQNASALSLASLSLSSSPPPLPQITPSFTAVSNAITTQVNGNSVTSIAPLNQGSDNLQHSFAGDTTKASTVAPIPISNGKSGKKRGMDHKCESCSKIYRHPSCLIKHRWEHTPHWREASKFVLSKHQQVQLLEAAAILSHLSPSSPGTSLPDDRSLWPSFLSGGSLPLPEGVVQPTTAASPGTSNPAPVSPSSYTTHPTSSSVPVIAMHGNLNRAPSAGPRLHDYSIPASATASGGITQLRPGLLGVLTGSGVVVASTPPMPVPVPNTNGVIDSLGGYPSGISDSWASSYGNGNASSSYLSGGFSYTSLPYVHSDERSVETGGWSLPRSSLRSVSGSSKSRSRSGSASGSRSDEESVDVDVEGDLDDYSASGYGRQYSLSTRGRAARAWKTEEEDYGIGFSVREEDEGNDGMVVNGTPPNKKEPEWDGLEMDMDMDMDMDG